MMKKFQNWGIKKRVFKTFNYNAAWFPNLTTIRFGEGVASELPPDQSEFYDVGIGTKCTTGKCNFCYVSSDPNGKFFDNICETWNLWMTHFWERKKNNVTFTNKPFQIAIGSTGCPLEHPDFPKFLETVFNTNVVPNYTTNGVILSMFDKPDSIWYKHCNEIIEATRKCVGGVAVSFGNKSLRPYAEKAVQVLLDKCDCAVNIHHIISDKDSVDEFINIQKKYGDSIKYHVLLPLMPNGRSTKSIDSDAFDYLQDEIKKNEITNIAYGAHFIENLTKNTTIKVWTYPPESLSKNIILEDHRVVITPSSFDLTPVKTITL